MAERFNRLLDPDASPALEPFRVGVGQLSGEIHRTEPFRPILVFGPQRSGKTRGIVVPTVESWSGPVVATSIRLDVFERTVRARAALGGSVYVYDPAGVFQDTEIASGATLVSWDPLSVVESSEDAKRLAENLSEVRGRISGVENEDFWQGKAVQLLHALLFAAASGGKDLKNVVTWVNSINVKDAIGSCSDETVLSSLLHFDRLDEKTRSSIFTTLSEMLSVFDYPTVIDAAVKGGLALEEFLDGLPNTLYLCAPPEDQKKFGGLFISVMRYLMRLATRKNWGFKPWTDSAPPCPLLVMLDEAGNIAPFEDLDSLATYAAGSGIQLVSVFHDLSQLTELYGEGRARTIVNNHSSLLILPGSRDYALSELVRSACDVSIVVGARSPGGPQDVAAVMRALEPGEALHFYESLPPTVLRLPGYLGEKQ